MDSALLVALAIMGLALLCSLGWVAVVGYTTRAVDIEKPTLDVQNHIGDPR